MKLSDNQKSMLEAKALVIKALGHPTRLWMVENLAENERCVCEFVEAIDADFSTVSKHLLVLKQAGIVEDEKRGKKVYYRLAVPCIMNFVGCIETVIQARLQAQIEMFGN